MLVFALLFQMPVDSGARTPLVSIFAIIFTLVSIAVELTQRKRDADSTSSRTVLCPNGRHKPLLYQVSAVVVFNEIMADMTPVRKCFLWSPER
jgi:hypothetical protein